jgi:glycosyltransferase involved in cell wall biosynthesis
MKALFVHQNGLGQFRHLAQHLAADNANQIVSLSINKPKFEVPGLGLVQYRPTRGNTPNAPTLIADFEAKVIRAEACAGAAQQLRQRGFTPDVILCHPGWGEHIFLREVWPDAKILMFMEFFYRTQGYDAGFDPEFDRKTEGAISRLRVKNANLLMALDVMDWAYAPTHWQKSALPAAYHDRTSVIFDGIDTGFITPEPGARFTLPDGRVLSEGDEVLTFVNRNMEPYRGFHIFMRALPAIQKARPDAITVIVGGEDVSYGAKPKDAPSWKAKMLAEVGDRLDMRRLVFTGPLAYGDYRQLLRVSRAHAYLTYPFVLSWSMLESMAAECLVVGSTTPPVLEVLEPGVTGLGVDFFDIDGWARTLTDALARPAEFAPLRKAARRKIVSTYDLTTICLPQQVRLLDDLVAGRKPQV